MLRLLGSSSFVFFCSHFFSKLKVNVIFIRFKFARFFFFVLLVSSSRRPEFRVHVHASFSSFCVFFSVSVVCVRVHALVRRSACEHSVCFVY